METRANFVLIGLFTLAGIAGLVGMLVWFARVELDQRFAYYDVRFTSVAGLSEASDVRFAGLPVGQVVDVRLSPDRSGTVLVRLEVDAETPVRTDSVATIEAQGVTGVSFVGISAGESSSELLLPSSDAPVPEIDAGQSAFQALTEDAPQLLTEALEVIEEVNTLLGSENQERVANILENAETASNALADTLDAFAEVPDTVQRFTDQVEAFNAILAGIAPEVETLLTTADSTVGALGALSEEASTMIVTANDTLTVAQSTFNEAQRFLNEDLTNTTIALERAITDLQGEIAVISDSAQSVLATFDETGAVATQRLTEAEATLAQASETLTILSQTATTVEETASGFTSLLDTQAEPLIVETRATVARAADAIDTIAQTAETDLPVIIEDIRTATATASEAIQQVAADLSGASGRIDLLTTTGQTALEDAIETFAIANVTLEAITDSMAIADETLIAAEETFTGANRIINEDMDQIITTLQNSIANLNGAIVNVSGEIPLITADLRNASRSAAQAFGSIEAAVDSTSPAVTEFARTGLPLFTRVADETRGLIRNLDRLTQQIERDPTRFFLDRQSPEFQR